MNTLRDDVKKSSILTFWIIEQLSSSRSLYKTMDTYHLLELEVSLKPQKPGIFEGIFEFQIYWKFIETIKFLPKQAGSLKIFELNFSLISSETKEFSINGGDEINDGQVRRGESLNFQFIEKVSPSQIWFFFTNLQQKENIALIKSNEINFVPINNLNRFYRSQITTMIKPSWDCTNNRWWAKIYKSYGQRLQYAMI